MKARAVLLLTAGCLLFGLPCHADDGLRLSVRLSGVAAAPASVASLAAAPATAMPVVPAADSNALALSKGGPRDYRIGSEDLLDVQVFGVDQLSRTVRVNSRGMISLPLIGSVEVAGMTAQEAESSITRRLADTYLQNPQVSLFIKEFTTQRVIIEGAVARPGVYPLRGQGTLLTALALAGGQGSLSDLSEVMLFRADASGKRAATAYDIERIRRGEIEDPAVINDDMIVVNRSKTRTALKDSLFRDILDTFNPMQWGRP